MKQEDKLRNTLREYYDTREVPLNDNEWERASIYLTNARRKRRIRYSALILLTLLSTLFIALFIFQEVTSDNKRQIPSLSNQKSGPASHLHSKPLPQLSSI